jgi:hypothetical protein
MWVFHDMEILQPPSEPCWALAFIGGLSMQRRRKE